MRYTKYHTSRPIFLRRNCFPTQLCPLHTCSKDPLSHFLEIAAPSPQSWRGQGGTVPPQTVSVLQIWGKYVGIKRHLLKLALLLYKVQEIFKSKEVFLEFLSFRGIRALNVSKILLIIGFIVYMTLKIIPSVFVQNKKREKIQLFALSDRNHSILTTWWALGVN